MKELMCIGGTKHGQKIGMMPDLKKVVIPIVRPLSADAGIEHDIKNFISPELQFYELYEEVNIKPYGMVLVCRGIQNL